MHVKGAKELPIIVYKSFISGFLFDSSLKNSQSQFLVNFLITVSRSIAHYHNELFSQLTTKTDEKKSYAVYI